MSRVPAWAFYLLPLNGDKPQRCNGEMDSVVASERHGQKFNSQLRFFVDLGLDCL